MPRAPVVVLLVVHGRGCLVGEPRQHAFPALYTALKGALFDERHSRRGKVLPPMSWYPKWPVRRRRHTRAFASLLLRSGGSLLPLAAALGLPKSPHLFRKGRRLFRSSPSIAVPAQTASLFWLHVHAFETASIWLAALMPSFSQKARCRWRSS